MSNEHWNFAAFTIKAGKAQLHGTYAEREDFDAAVDELIQDGRFVFSRSRHYNDWAEHKAEGSMHTVGERHMIMAGYIDDDTTVPERS